MTCLRETVCRLHQGDARPVFTKHPLVGTETLSNAKGQNTVGSTFDLADKDGQPILFLRTDWLDLVSSGLILQIHQNGEMLHELKGSAYIIYQHIKDICVGGYVNGDLYHAYWLLPLQRKVGQNHLQVEVASSGPLNPLLNLIRTRQNQVRGERVNPERELRVLTESAIEIWPEWETITLPQK